MKSPACCRTCNSDHAHRNRLRSVKPQGRGWQSGDILAKSFGQLQRFLLTGVGTQHEELFASITAQDIGLAAGRLHALEDRLQGLVANEVAMPVIDLLEMIQVQQNGAERLLIAAMESRKLFELSHQIAPD